MRVEGHVGPSTTVDGQEGIALRQGRNAELIVTNLHGRYYEQVSRGNTYYATSTIGLIAAATAGGHPTLFNPLGSNVNLSVTHLHMAYASGTHVAGGVFWAYTLNCGASQATAGAILTFTRVASVNALIGSQNVAKGQWSPTTNTFTAIPVPFMGTGISETVITQASTENPNQIVISYDGTLVVAPGNAISLVHNAAGGAGLWYITVVWEEVPI